MECLLEKIGTCSKNLEESSATEINKYTPSGFSLFTHCSFDKIKNKLNCYRGEDCMKKFCKDLREHATKIINYEKKDDTINKKEEKTITSKKFVTYAKKNLMQMIKNTTKSKTIVIMRENIEVQLIISAIQDIEYQKKSQ